MKKFEKKRGGDAPMTGSDLFCVWLKKRVKRNESCVPMNKEAGDTCVKCNSSREILIAEQQHYVETGYAVWTETDTGEKIVIQNQ